MVVTHSGVPGAGHVVRRVAEEFSSVIVHAPNPHPETTAKAAAHWDELKNPELVTYSAARVFYVSLSFFVSLQ